MRRAWIVALRTCLILCIFAAFFFWLLDLLSADSDCVFDREDLRLDLEASSLWSSPDSFSNSISSFSSDMLLT